METPPLPSNERERLRALRTLGLLDTPAEERFDRYTRLARRLFDVPIALVSLVDENRQWFKARQGLEATETSRDVSFCAHAILDDQAYVVEDARRDPRFRDNPLVCGEPGIRFYAGYPIRGPDGSALGTLCVIDREPRRFEEADVEALRDLGEMVETEIAAFALAAADELTGLANRRGFTSVATYSLASCARRNTVASLLYFDLDRFKAINDEYGHAEGDRVLVEFASILCAAFRNSDVVARLGGDEYAVVLADTGAAGAATALARFEEILGRRNAATEAAHRLECSVGVATCDPSEGCTPQTLLDQADRRMYALKRERAGSRHEDPMG